MFTQSPPPDSSGFVPRKEFIREQKLVKNNFALFAISGSNFVRLYSFPSNVISSLRTLFEKRGAISGFREDAVRNLCEFNLDGRPWYNSKAIRAERLLVEILAVIYQHGFSFLSTIDYGRESDDKVAIVFSIPSSSLDHSRATSPYATSPVRGSSSVISHQSQIRIPFALSFPSATLLRVISPPLHSTPAILQAVRSAWPRGVVSEKKVDDTYEFKLRGYRWFQEDTFATDSLQYILTLLTSLDSQSFTLLTSLSLTTRSRVKDLWIFTGLGPPPGDIDSRESISSQQASYTDLKREHSHTPPHGHKRVPSAPQFPQPQLLANPQGHHRNLTDTFTHPRRNSFHSPSRREIPRLPTPKTREHEPTYLDSYKGAPVRAELPSEVSNGTQNMTGVGTSIGPDGQRRPETLISSFYIPSKAPKSRPFALPKAVGRWRNSELLRSKSPSATSQSSSPGLSALSLSSPQPNGFPSPALSSPVPPLLSAGVFRDTAFSSETDVSQDIPIRWTGKVEKVVGEHSDEGYRTEEGRGKTSMKPSEDRDFPGGWNSELSTPTPPTPTRKQNGGAYPPILPTPGRGPAPDDALQKVSSRVSAPEVVKTPEGMRRSEMASFGVFPSQQIYAPRPIPPPQPLPPAPSVSKLPPKSQKSGRVRPAEMERYPSDHTASSGPSPSSSTKGKSKEVLRKRSDLRSQGWVLVNVEGKPQSPGGKQTGRRTPVNGSAYPASPSSPLSRSDSDRMRIEPRQQQQTLPQASVSPAAKAIVIVDALEARSKTKTVGKGEEAGASGVKRFFSLSKKAPGRAPVGDNER